MKKYFVINMKNTLISLCLILSFYANSQFMPNTGDILEYPSFYVPTNSNEPDVTYKITIGGDTLVGNQNCKRFISEYATCSNFGFKAFVFEKDSVVCFFKNKEEVYDTLYDFTKKKNEHWKINYSDNLYFIVQVDSVYSTMLKGKEYKTLNVTYFIYEKDFKTQEFRSWNKYCSKIVEKFGDIHYYFHLTNAESDCFGSYVSNGLSKYITLDSDKIDLSGFDLGCRASVVSAVSKKKSQTIEIYPNYVSSKLYLKSEHDLESLLQVVIFDLTGTVYSLPIKSNEIDVSALSSGLYLLKIDNQTYKFMKE